MSPQEEKQNTPKDVVQWTFMLNSLMEVEIFLSFTSFIYKYFG